MPERLQPPTRALPVRRVTRGLGWFSIGLGIAQLIAPRALSKLMGISDGPRPRWALRAMGVCEIAAGIGVLSGSRTDASTAPRLGRATAELPVVQPSTMSVTIAASPDEVAREWQDYETIEAPLAGAVRVVPGPGGRTAHVHFEYVGGAGPAVESYLRRFKQWVEVGPRQVG